MSATRVMHRLAMGLLCSAALAPPNSSAGDATTGSLVQISGDSPFGPANACGNFPGVVPGTLYLNSEVEPWVEVNPNDPANIVAFWQQDRWSNGGARGLVAGVSKDGGSTWTQIVVPGLSQCSGGSYERATDPWLSFSPDGTLHQIALLLDLDPSAERPGGFGRNALAVSKSLDGGTTWSTPIIIAQDEDPRVLNDKQSLTADPTDSNYVYAVWDRLQVPLGSVINPENVFGLGYKGPALFARSSDGGDTWEAPRVLYDPAANNQTIGNQIVVQPGGRLINFFNEIANFRNDEGGAQFDFNLAFKHSPDKGKTWLPRGPAVRVQKILSAGITTPDVNQPVRDAASLFDVAVDPDDGRLYAVWQDARFRGSDEVAFSMSPDGGATWSAPIRVNQTPFNSDPRRRQAFVPSVSVVPGTGDVVVTYYDFRNDPAASSELTDHWAVHCHADCGNPASWTSEIRLTEASFDISKAPFARGFFLGDYVGLTATGANALSVFTQTHGTDPASAFFRRITP